VSRPQGLFHDVPGHGRRTRAARIGRPTSWIRVSTRIAHHPDLVRLPSNDARWAYIVLLTAAKEQPEPGEYRDQQTIGHVLGRGLRQCLPALLDTGLVLATTEGGYVLPNWQRWQTPNRVDGTHANRQRAYREREKAKSDARHSGVTLEKSVTPSDGGPPIGDYATVTRPSGEAAMTVQTSIETRRVLAKAIRDARPDHRSLFLATFEKQYAETYPRPRPTPVDRLHPAMRACIRETWATFMDQEVPV
jgi:hypothetical protein